LKGAEVRWSKKNRGKTEVAMNDLKQVQPLVDAQGRLLHLVGLDARGNVYFGRLTAAGHDKYKLVWTQMEESDK